MVFWGKFLTSNHKMGKRKNIPVHLQLIHYLKAGFAVLDETVQQEVIAFVEEQQHKNGGFVNRGGNPDLYYSLFGFWLALATGNSNAIEKLKSFINTQKEDKTLGAIDEMVLLLIDAELSPGKKHSLFSLLKMVFVKGKKIGLSYRFFLLTLIVDAQNSHKKLYYFFARIGLFFFKPKGNLPCSLIAALTFAKKTVGLKCTVEQQKLFSYYVESGGFRAFESVPTADTLSTAVALFALRETAFDMEIITPDCLGFIQQNYNSGAFLSGDGDETRDLEYTFYGLLALGTLIQ
jgi:hypothetical protein